MSEKYITRTGRSGRVFVARLKLGSDLLHSLQEIVIEEGIMAGVILTGLGLLGEARLRNCESVPKEFPITDSNRSFLDYNEPLEILSLSGTVSTAEGSPLIHAHITLSGVEKKGIKVIGGHLIDGCVVAAFAEVVIMELEDIEMVKGYDAETRTLQLFE